MSFHTYVRRVRRNDLPFKARRLAFRSCIESHYWLTKQRFQTTYSRYSNHFGFDEDVPDADARLNSAMNALERERNLFLEQLRLFDKKRVKEKMRGRRSPSKSSVEALYNGEWFSVRDTKG